MAKLCEDLPCIKSDVDLFTPTPRQVAMTKSTWVDFHPVSTITGNAPIEFFIAGPTDAYLDLSQTMLVVRAKVTRADGTPLDHTNADAAKKDTLAPCNNLLHSLFSDVSLTFNEKPIEGSTHMYAYKAYMSTLLQYDRNVKKHQLFAQGFALDKAGEMEDVDKEGFKTREALIHGSRVFELAGPLHLDFFQQGKNLLNLVNARVKLTPSSPEFALQWSADAVNYKISITSATLHVRKVGIKPSILLDNEAKLKREPAVYPQQHSEMVTYTIPSGSQSNTKDNLFRGLMPKFMLVAMTTNEAYNGKNSKNPFNFQPFDVNYIGLFREGECITGQPLTPDFSPNSQLCVRDYLYFYQNLEQFGLNESCSISFKEFLNGYTMFAFNLTPDMEMAGHTQEDKEGNLRLELRFAKALPSSINVIIMAIFDGKVIFDSARIPTTDFNV